MAGRVGLWRQPPQQPCIKTASHRREGVSCVKKVHFDFVEDLIDGQTSPLPPQPSGQPLASGDDLPCGDDGEEQHVEEQHIEVIYNYEVKFINLLPPTNFHK